MVLTLRIEPVMVTDGVAVAVSYTHLDVYKRQGILFLRRTHVDLAVPFEFARWPACQLGEAGYAARLGTCVSDRSDEVPQLGRGPPRKAWSSAGPRCLRCQISGGSSWKQLSGPQRSRLNRRLKYALRCECCTHHQARC